MPDTDHISKMNVPHGLYTLFISPTSGNMQGSIVTVGARVDSIYEYFLKQWCVCSLHAVAYNLLSPILCFGQDHIGWPV